MSEPMQDRTPPLVGDSEAIRNLRATVSRVARTTLPVLLVGPTGAGKDVVARRLHAESGRSGRYVPVNVCAVGDAMFEDALFGHVRGAFTGALATTSGLLMEAHRGTLFLDEIGSLPVGSQAKLLRALETRSFRPVGAQQDSTSEFRIVAATNEAPRKLVGDGRFRADLFHRLAGITIPVPSLASRLEDIPLLIQSYLRSEGLERDVRLQEGALARLREHAWPGNVRELFATVARMLVVSQNGEITAATADAAIECGVETFASAPRDDERGQLLRLLAEHEWNVDRAAASLGLHRATMYRRIRRLGVELPMFELTWPR